MKTTKIVVSGQEIHLSDLGDQDLGAAFVGLYSAYWGTGAYSWSDFETAALTFFGNPSGSPDFERDNRFFRNFAPIWERLVRARQYEEAERVWEHSLDAPLKWERANPGQYIHKGTPYYFWAVTAAEKGDIDKCYVLMHRAVEEDSRTEPELFKTFPAYTFVTLNPQPNQAYLHGVLRQAQYVQTKLNGYCQSHQRRLAFGDFQRRFLEAPPSIDSVFLFTYTLARVMRLGFAPEHGLTTKFVSLLETQLLFDFVLVIDVAIFHRGSPSWKFSEHAKYLAAKASQPLADAHVREIKAAFDNDIDRALGELLDLTFTLSDGTKLTPLQRDLAVSYGLRNFAAHKVTFVGVIAERFREVEQAVMNTLFAAVEYLY